jgi:uncharacterized integral membrane protein
MRWTRRVIGGALFLVLLVGGWRFAAENSGSVTVHYLLGRSGEVAIWAALLGAFGAGAALVALLSLLQTARLRLEARRYRKVVRGLEAEVHQLRNLPLAPDDAGTEHPQGREAVLEGRVRGP